MAVLSVAKFSSLAIILAASVIFKVVPALAQEDQTSQGGFYASLGAGINKPMARTGSLQLSSDSSGVPTPYDFGTGYNFLVSGGYRWGSHIRTEVEFDYRHADVDHLEGFATTGDQRVMSLSANVLYDITVSRLVVPYIGGGLGAAQNHWGNVDSTVEFADFNGGDIKLQWQGIAGVSFRVTPATSLFVDYRYVAVGDAKIKGSIEDSLRVADRSNNAMVGVRLFF